MEKGKTKDVATQTSSGQNIESIAVSGLSAGSKPEADTNRQQAIKKARTWWDDLYTDGLGQCFSDADPGL